MALPWWLSELRIFSVGTSVVQVAAVVQVRPLTQELPHVMNAEKKKKKEEEEEGI